MNHIIEVGFSPCPNDTFIFNGIISGDVPTRNYCFHPVIEDVETLNRWALEAKLPITKISFGTLMQVSDKYILLDAGSALGMGVGPLLISKETFNEQDPKDFCVAIPGKNTTAHVLFSMAYPQAKNKVFLRYDQIEQYVLEGKGPGVIIHENRFTYKGKGLHLWSDLGKVWEDKLKAPIPLGGIVIKKSLHDFAPVISGFIKRSIEKAQKDYPILPPFVVSYAQEMDEEIMRKHIELYVNNFSLSLGQAGRLAIEKFQTAYAQLYSKEIPEIEII